VRVFKVGSCIRCGAAWAVGVDRQLKKMYRDQLKTMRATA